MREFMHVDDLASAVAFALDNDLPETLYNVGTGTDLHIRELAAMIQEITGHQGEIVWDTTKPNGTPRKLMDVSRLKSAGWSATIPLEDGLRSTYAWFLEHQDTFKRVTING
jgi:GDP-L-fucose synthase